MVDNLIYEIPKWFSNIIAALGGVIFLYLFFQIVSLVFNRRRKKILELIRKDLNRIEKKIDILKNMPNEGKRTYNKANEKKRNK